MYWTVPKIWENETCFIIGGGPSLASQLGIPDTLLTAFKNGSAPIEALHQYFTPFKTSHTIGVNMAYKFGADFIDIVFIGDLGFLKTNTTDLQNFNGLIVTCAPMFPPSPNIKTLMRDRKKTTGIVDDPTKVAWNGHSGGSAINLAIHLGAKRIVLLGFDLNSSPANEHHWHKYYQTKSQKLQNVSYILHMRGYADIAKDAEKLGVEILNASPTSAINVFKKVTLKECLS